MLSFFCSCLGPPWLTQLPRLLHPIPSPQSTPKTTHTNTNPSIKPGLRAHHATTAFLTSLTLTHSLIPLYTHFFNTLSHLKDSRLTIIIQFIFPSIFARMHTNNGTGLGLSKAAEEEGVFLLALAINWKDAKDDEIVVEAVKQLIGNVERGAREEGRDVGWRYANYAGLWQEGDMWEGLGGEVVEGLRALQRSVDPGEVFVRGGLCGGGFRLNEKGKGK